MHPLKSYLSALGLTEEAFAKTLDPPTTASYVSQIICGHRYPSRPFAKRLSDATGGLVKVSDLMDFERAA